MKDLEKQKNEFNQHPIPKCMFQFFIQIFDGCEVSAADKFDFISETVPYTFVIRGDDRHLVACGFQCRRQRKSNIRKSAGL